MPRLGLAGYRCENLNDRTTNNKPVPMYREHDAIPAERCALLTTENKLTLNKV